MTNTQIASTNVTNLTNSYKSELSKQLQGLGWSPADINSVTSHIDNNPISKNAVKGQLDSFKDSAKSDLSNSVQKSLDVGQLSPENKSGAVNGLTADRVEEPINVKKVSSPIDIPDDTNSLQSDHPSSFGKKDRGGNWSLFNMVRKLYQAGLRNGLLFRSDKQGNTTLKVPGHLKVSLSGTYNVNSKSYDHIVDGEIYLKATDRITLEAPNIDFKGDVTIFGIQVNKKTISASGDITSKGIVEGKVDLIFSGTRCTLHKHKAQGAKAITTKPI